MQSLQIHAPEMKAIQQKYKADRQRQSEELMKFYKENKINPYASCLPIVFQIPIFISLFYVLKDFEKEIFRQSGGSLDWLGLVNITRRSASAGGRSSSPSTSRASFSRRPDVDRDAEPVAADHDHGAAGRLPPLHPAVSVRPDDLLADDQPVDDRAGAHHSTADAEAGGASQALEPYGSRGRASGAAQPASVRRQCPPEGLVRTAAREAQGGRAQPPMSPEGVVRVEATGETVGEAKWAALRELEHRSRGSIATRSRSRSSPRASAASSASGSARRT